MDHDNHDGAYDGPAVRAAIADHVRDHHNDDGHDCADECGPDDDHGYQLGDITRGANRLHDLIAQYAALVHEHGERSEPAQIALEQYHRELTEADDYVYLAHVGFARTR
jgi:hypothetical protein